MASPSLWCWCFISQADQFDSAQLQDKLQKDALAVLKDESNPHLLWRYIQIFVVDPIRMLFNRYNQVPTL